jgi:uncharacterized protein YcbK (DUF882 family)
MRFLNYRSFKILKICIVIFFVFLLFYLIVSKDARRNVRIYFSSSCIGYKQPVFSRKLTDKIVDYSDQSRSTGIIECKNENEIHKMVSEGKLVRVNSGRRFIIEKLSYSYPYLTIESRDLLNDISKRFRSKTEKAGLNGARFIVTSMTRTTEKMKVLRKNNGNASVNSPHLRGNAFDITYVRFSCRKLFVTECDKRFMKEALAEIIWQLSEEKRCWATYETQQSCFHVVAR